MSKDYKCLNCGHTFNEDDMGYSSEWIGEDKYSSNSSGYIYYNACPKCGSEEIAEAEECVCCCESYDKENEMIEVDGYWYCHECAGKIYDAYWLAWGRFEEKNDGSI